MRITDYSISQQFINGLANVQSNMMNSYQQLSSGQKLTNPSDNPSDVSTVFGMESNLRSNVQYISNLGRANNVSQNTYSVISQLKSVITNAETVGTTAGGVTNSSSDLTAQADQIDQYVQTALDLANSKMSGSYLFSGNTTHTQPFSIVTDKDGVQSVQYKDGLQTAVSDPTSSITVAEGVTMSPYSSHDQNVQLATAMNHLMALSKAIKSGKTADIQAATTALGTDEDNVINQMSGQAAIQSRVQSLQNMVKSNSNTIDSSISAKADADIATATVQYNQMQTSYQAAIAAGSKMLSSSLLSYLGVTGG